MVDFHLSHQPALVLIVNPAVCDDHLGLDVSTNMIIANLDIICHVMEIGEAGTVFVR